MKSGVKFKIFNNLVQAPCTQKGSPAVKDRHTCWTSILDNQAGGQGCISQGPRRTTMARASWVMWRQFNKGALYTGVGREVTRAMGISGTITTPSNRVEGDRSYYKQSCTERRAASKEAGTFSRGTRPSCSGPKGKPPVESTPNVAILPLPSPLLLTPTGQRHRRAREHS